MMCAVCMFDGRRQEELIDLKDGQIDALRALLREARERETRYVLPLYRDDNYMARIDAALTGKDAT